MWGMNGEREHMTYRPNIEYLPSKLGCLAYVMKNCYEPNSPHTTCSLSPFDVHRRREMNGEEMANTEVTACRGETPDTTQRSREPD